MNSAVRKSLTVVMPAYNEEGAIQDAVTEVIRCILDQVPDSELLIIDDGSRDRTPELTDQLSQRYPAVRVIHQFNRGHGPSVHRGLEESKGEFVFLMDSDRQIPLDQFMAIWSQRASCDAIFGVRKKRHDPLLRLWITGALRCLIRLYFGVTLYDANVPFKLIRRNLWEEAREHIPESALVPSLLLAIFVARRGAKLSFQDVSHRERATGVVSIRRWKLLRFCLRALGDVVRFKSSLV